MVAYLNKQPASVHLVRLQGEVYRGVLICRYLAALRTTFSSALLNRASVGLDGCR